MNTELEPGESVIRESRANMQRSSEQAAGRLILTDQRLIFEANRFNVRKGTDWFIRDAIATVEGRWTKFFGFIPLASNTLVVTLTGGRQLRFVVPNRDEWLQVLAPGGSQTGS